MRSAEALRPPSTSPPRAPESTGGAPIELGVPATDDRGLSAVPRVLRNFWPFADQGLISATNFVTMVLLARALNRSEFGSFTLVYSALLFVNSLQSTLITQPHNVLGVGLHGAEYQRYTSSTALVQLCVAIAAGICAMLAGGILSLMRLAAAPLLVALGPLIVAWQLQEFGRRVLYTERRFAAAFANDVVSYAGQAVLLAIFWRFGVLSSVTALLAVAVTSAIGAMYVFIQLRGSLVRGYDGHALKENWHFGKWLAGGELLRWLSSVEMYQYLAAAMLGTAATATLKSAQVVFGPTRLLLFSLNSILPIQFAHELRSGRTHLHSELKRVYLVTAIPLGVYCGAVALLAAPLLRLLYGSRYAGSASVLVLYSVSAFVSYIAIIVSAALQAKRQTRSVFDTYGYTSVVALSLGWIFIRMFGVEGALVGMILTSCVAALLFWRAYRRTDARELPGERADLNTETEGVHG